MGTKRIDYREIVARKLHDELDVYAAARGKSHIYESLTGTTEHISVSYKGRTLIELIQNAYDPHHSDRSDGEITILLDIDEGTHGCLYVANKGSGFTQDNFHGI